MFVTPYPPGFPILVPGPVVTLEIPVFNSVLDTSGITGRLAQFGCRVFALAAIRGRAGRGAVLGAEATDPRVTSRRSLHVREGHNGRRLLDWLADVQSTDAIDVTPTPLGEAVGGLHATLGDEDAQVCALEAVVARGGQSPEEALVGQLVPVVRHPQKSLPSLLSW